MALQSSTLVQRPVDSDVIHEQLSHTYNRVKGVFNNNTGAAAKFDKGLITQDSTGKYVPLALAASANGVLLTNTMEVADTADVDVVIVNEGTGVVLVKEGLDFNGVDEATTITQLESLGFKVVSRIPNDPNPASGFTV